MPLLHIIILALVQGITEFLPISSSGHLILAHNALGQNLEPEAWDDMMMMDIAVHVGTLFSVLVYFRSDLCDMVSDIKTTRHNGLNSKGGKLARNIIISSLPVILAGFVLFQLNLSILRSLDVDFRRGAVGGGSVLPGQENNRLHEHQRRIFDWLGAILCPYSRHQSIRRYDERITRAWLFPP
jgi:undecaprenyl pyrophosphate phosphatase UppP